MKKKSAESVVEEILTRRILNGECKAFSLLKPEREMAVEFGYSRPVIHKAIIRMESKGLLTIIPRQGIKVNDYRENAKLGLLESIYDLYHEGISKTLNKSMIEFIKNNLESMIRLIISGDEKNRNSCFEKQKLVKLEKNLDIFIWLQNFALYSGNSIYPMLLNEFKVGILNVSDAVLRYGDRNILKEKVKNVTFLLSSEDKDQSKYEYHEIDNLFSFIEKNWLREEENNEI